LKSRSSVLKKISVIVFGVVGVFFGSLLLGETSVTATEAPIAITLGGGGPINPGQ